MYFVDRKATPTVTNLANQLRAHARVRGIVWVCHVVRGVWVHVRGVDVSAMSPNVKIFDPCAGAQGTPHPPGICYANPTSFLYFLGYRYGIFANHWGSLRTVGYPYCSLLGLY